MDKAPKTDTWMPLFIGDYLKYTARLSTEQHGAYILLIMDYWTNGPPADDDEELAVITRLDLRSWRRHRPKIERYFRIEDGVWRHKRIDAELSAAQGKSDKAAEKARLAAEARWNKQRDKQSSASASGSAGGSAASNAQAHARSMLEDCPSPSPSEEYYSVPNGTGASPPSEASPDEDLDPLADLRALPVAKGSWRLAVKVLTEQGRLTETKARTFVGSLKAKGLTDDELWQIAEGAWKAETEAPQPYLVKAAEEVIGRRGSFDPMLQPEDWRQRRWMAEFVEGQFPWDPRRGPKPGEPGCRVAPAIQREYGVEPAAPQAVRGAA
jgi:Uncharacterized protein conserved in bacteria